MASHFQRLFPLVEVDLDAQMKQFEEYGASIRTAFPLPPVSWQPLAEKIRPMVTDTTMLMQQMLKDGKKVLVEGRFGFKRRLMSVRGDGHRQVPTPRCWTLTLAPTPT